jgi:hypothetical protein
MKKFIHCNFFEGKKLELRPQRVKVFKAISGTVELHYLRHVSGFATPEFHHSVVFVPNEFRVGEARVVHARQLEAHSTAVSDKVKNISTKKCLVVQMVVISLIYRVLNNVYCTVLFSLRKFLTLESLRYLETAL